MRRHSSHAGFPLTRRRQAAAIVCCGLGVQRGGQLVGCGDALLTERRQRAGEPERRPRDRERRDARSRSGRRPERRRRRHRPRARRASRRSRAASSVAAHARAPRGRRSSSASRRSSRSATAPSEKASSALPVAEEWSVRRAARPVTDPEDARAVVTLGRRTRRGSPRRTPNVTASPVAVASRSMIGSARLDERRERVARLRKPRELGARARSASPSRRTNPRRSSAAISRETVLLWMPSSCATSVTPSESRPRPKLERIRSARSADCMVADYATSTRGLQQELDGRFPAALASPRGGDRQPGATGRARALRRRGDVRRHAPPGRLRVDAIPDAYTSREFHALERERVFGTAWVPVCVTDEVARAGRVRRRRGRRSLAHRVPEPRRRASRAPQRLPAPRRAARHGAAGRGRALLPVPLPRVGVRPRRSVSRARRSSRPRRGSPRTSRTSST